MTTIEVFAPAKINLSLHVTGQRSDGYHLLDSLVMFANVGDKLRVAPSAQMSLKVTGPMASGVPEDETNLCWKAAKAFGEHVSITLDKQLPAAAGIGGGSSDAAAVIAAMEKIYARPFAGDPAHLGADVPVCRLARAARMRGIGDDVTRVTAGPFHAVLVNPRVAVSTPEVFRVLQHRDNPPMTALPDGVDAATGLQWLKSQRNDLQPPAIALLPAIQDALKMLDDLPGQTLTRMSGSGATCFALFETHAQAQDGATSLQALRPAWWVTATVLT